MSKNLFVPKHLGQELKQLGFSTPCIGVFVEDGTKVMTAGGTGFFKSTHPYYHENCAILYSQVKDWFREVYDVDIEVVSFRNLDSKKGYLWKIFERDGCAPSKMISDYYECYNILIEEAIKLIKNHKIKTQ
jgi:hypothetical protein